MWDVFGNIDFMNGGSATIRLMKNGADPNFASRNGRNLLHEFMSNLSIK